MSDASHRVVVISETSIQVVGVVPTPTIALGQVAGIGDLSGAQDGDSLTYDAGSGLWIPGEGGGGAESFAELLDVDDSARAEGFFIRFRTASNLWVAEAVALSDLAGWPLALGDLSDWPAAVGALSDVTVAGAAEGYLFRLRSGVWTAEDFPAIPSELADLSDWPANIEDLANVAQVLAYADGHVLQFATGLGFINTPQSFLAQFGDAAQIATSSTVADGVRTALLTAAGLTITLPSGTPDGRALLIKDTSGGAAASPHTIAAPGGQTIEGGASVSLAADRGALLVVPDAAGNWHVVGRHAPATGWTALSLSASWTDPVSADWMLEPATGRVTLRGVLTSSGAVATGSAMLSAALPARARPAQEAEFIVGLETITVGTDGTITYDGPGTGGGTIRIPLNGLTWRTS